MVDMYSTCRTEEWKDVFQSVRVAEDEDATMQLFSLRPQVCFISNVLQQQRGPEYDPFADRGNRRFRWLVYEVMKGDHV